MSFDLAFWYQKYVPSTTDAARIYGQLADGNEGVVEESPAIREFHQAVISRYPDITEENMEEVPWASALYVTNECVIAAISWSRSREVASVLLELAARHGLIAYDPQEVRVHGKSV